VAGKPIQKVGTVGSEIIMNEAKSITIDRNGEKIELAIPEGFINQLNQNRLGGFTYVRIPLIVDSVLPSAKTIEGSVQKGDTLIEFNHHPARFNTDLNESFADLKDKTIDMTFLRPTGDTIKVKTAFNAKGDNGIRYKGTEEILGTRQINYSFLEAIPAGIKKSMQTLTNYIRNLKLLFTSKEVKVQDSLGSVVSITNIFPPIWDWQSFWTLTAVFSILLAFMNVLPIPALDGGHALFTLVEMITGRKPSDRFIEYAQMAGMILLFGLMAYALGLDIFRLFK